MRWSPRTTTTWRGSPSLHPGGFAPESRRAGGRVGRVEGGPGRWAVGRVVPAGRPAGYPGSCRHVGLRGNRRTIPVLQAWLVVGEEGRPLVRDERLGPPFP